MMEIDELFGKFEEKLKGAEADEYWNRFVVADAKVLQDDPQLEMPARTALALQLMQWY